MKQYNVISGEDDEPDRLIDRFEKALVDRFEVVDCPLVHKFAGGMYIRQITMPAGSWVVSMIHKTEHPFFVLEGAVSVFSANDGEQILEAGYSGITSPGTRRILYNHETTTWVTVHPYLDGETVDDIEARIIEPHDNELLDEQTKDILAQIHRYGLEPKNITSQSIDKQ